MEGLYYTALVVSPVDALLPSPLIMHCGPYLAIFKAH